MIFNTCHCLIKKKITDISNNETSKVTDDEYSAISSGDEENNIESKL